MSRTWGHRWCLNKVIFRFPLLWTICIKAECIENLVKGVPCWLPSLCRGAVEPGQGHGGRGGDPGQGAAPEVVWHQQVHQVENQKNFSPDCKYFATLCRLLLPNLSQLCCIKLTSHETQVWREHSTGCTCREPECLQGREGSACQLLTWYWEVIRARWEWY